ETPEVVPSESEVLSYKVLGSQSNWTGRIKLRRYAIMDCLTLFSLCDHKVLNINAFFNTT
ncbi:hypothetical protein KYD80_25750, partial [Escherichia coli]